MTSENGFAEDSNHLGMPEMVQEPPEMSKSPKQAAQPHGLEKQAVNTSFTTRWISELKEKPQKRKLFLRKDRQCDLEKRAVNVEAALIQLVGKVAKVPCKCCKTGSGPFTECVSVPEVCKDECANCHYGSGGRRCSFRGDYGTARSKKDNKSKSKSSRKLSDSESEDSSEEERPSKKARKSEKKPAKDSKPDDSAISALHKKVRLLRKSLRAVETSLDSIEEELENF